MLASITPLGERGRHAHWSITVTAFLIGATGAGVLAGALAGAAGDLVLSGSIAARTRLAILAIAVAIAIVLDVGPWRVPGPRRQVNELWLDQYRGWVYGLGYGAQLGVGLTTVVSSAATYVALLAAFLTADPGRGAAIVGCYGAVRGLQPLLAAGIRTPRQLIALHSTLHAWRGPAARLATAALLAILAAALAWTIA
jgi:hypothetical protein